MTSAAFFLITHNFKNRFVRSVQRLRQPRYVLGLLVAIVYFWSILFRRAAVSDIRYLRSGGVNDVVVLVASVIVLLFLIGSWAMPGDEPGLIFTEAEIQFFFAGPVSRRQLLAYKVLRSQVQNVFTAIIFAFFAFRGSHFLGMWLALGVLNLYFTFVSFARARLKQSGIGWLWRLAAVAVVVTIIGMIATHQLQGEANAIVQAFKGPHQQPMLNALTRIAWAPPLGSFLYLPALFGRTVYAPAPFLSAALLVLFGLTCFFLTTQLDVSFEDASIVASQRALTRRARMRGMRSGRSTVAVHRFPPLFQLAERGRPEVAVFWKNLIGMTRISSVSVLLIGLPLAFVAAMSIFGRRHGIPDLLGIMGLMLAGAFVFLGPMAVRIDLRTDIVRLDIIKAFPLSAEALVAAELAAPLVVISAFELLTLLISVFSLQFGRHYFEFFSTPEFIVCAFVFIVPTIAIQLLIQNALVVLFPAWNMTTTSRDFGAMGQRLLFLIGNIATLGVAFIPAAIVFVPSFWLAHRIMGGAPFGILLATIPAVAVLVGEIFVGHKFLSAQFEEIDMANDVEALSE